MGVGVGNQDLFNIILDWLQPAVKCGGSKPIMCLELHSPEIRKWTSVTALINFSFSVRYFNVLIVLFEVTNYPSVWSQREGTSLDRFKQKFIV